MISCVLQHTQKATPCTQHSHSTFVSTTVKMLPIKFLVALAAVYDGILYVLQPPNCSSASVTCDRNTTNATWYNMTNFFLADIPVFKLPVKTCVKNGFLNYKVQFNFTTYTFDTNWQTIMLNGKKLDFPKKVCVEPPSDYTGLVIVILSSLLLIIMSACIILLFIYWFLQSNNLR